MARMVVARDQRDISAQQDGFNQLRAAAKALSLKWRDTYCHGAIVFGRTFIAAYKHRSYNDVGEWNGLGGYYRNGKFLPFRKSERITEQNAGITCQ